MTRESRDLGSTLTAVSLPAGMVGRLGLEPRTYRFSDRCCGWSWIAPITCVFRNCERSSSAVGARPLARFSDRKVSK